MFDLKQSNYEKGGYIKEKMYLTLQEKQLPCCDKYEQITIYTVGANLNYKKIRH